MPNFAKNVETEVAFGPIARDRSAALARAVLSSIVAIFAVMLTEADAIVMVTAVRLTSAVSENARWTAKGTEKQTLSVVEFCCGRAIQTACPPP